MKTIQWLTNLDKGKLVVAMLLIAVSSLFVQNQVKEGQTQKLQESYRIELLRRADSCEVQKMKMAHEANEKIEHFLKQQLERAQRAERQVDSTVQHNSKIIRKNRGEVNKVKKYFK